MPVARPVTISAVQLPSYREGETDAEKRESNIAKACEMLEQAGRRGSDIACLGETFTVMGIQIDERNLREKLEPVPGEVGERAGEIARRHSMYVIAPVWGLVDDTPRNVALIIDREGEICGMYFKVHPTDIELDYGIIAGDDWPVFELDFGRIGVHICHDNSFPEGARCLALNGAEIIFWPHVQSAWGGMAWDITLRSRAIDNGVYHVSACYGVEGNRAWRPGMLVGRSGIVRPDGLIAAEAGRYADIATATVDLDLPRIVHGFARGGEHYYWIAAQVNRRPDSYGAITAPRKVTEHQEPPGPRPWLE
jgi:beta-ureidopropionase